jgi:hypothetical protein
MTMIIDGTNGITFNNSTVQASAGQVLQVVNASYSTTVSVSNATLVDTGLTASITPKFSTSKILVLVNQNGNIGSNTADVGMRVALLRGASQIALIDGAAAYNGAGGAPIGVGSIAISYLDSPATTSATTYKTQFANRTVGATGSVSTQNTSSTSTITLMEIAA